MCLNGMSNAKWVYSVPFWGVKGKLKETTNGAILFGSEDEQNLIFHGSCCLFSSKAVEPEMTFATETGSQGHGSCHIPWKARAIMKTWALRMAKCHSQSPQFLPCRGGN